jgi:hypothetical protein
MRQLDALVMFCDHRAPHFAKTSNADLSLDYLPRLLQRKTKQELFGILAGFWRKATLWNVDPGTRAPRPSNSPRKQKRPFAYFRPRRTPKEASSNIWKRRWSANQLGLWFLDTRNQKLQSTSMLEHNDGHKLRPLAAREAGSQPCVSLMLLL